LLGREGEGAISDEDEKLDDEVEDVGVVEVWYDDEEG
jgi:hypothetical protein